MENNKNQMGYGYHSVTINNNNTQQNWMNRWSSRPFVGWQPELVKLTFWPDRKDGYLP